MKKLRLREVSVWLKDGSGEVSETKVGDCSNITGDHPMALDGTQKNTQM